jgi:hypothetical protein
VIGGTEPIPPGHWSLDFDDLSRPHVCPMYGGARTYSLHLAAKRRWPPPAPIFTVGGTSLFRRWLRHMWLELDAGFGAFHVIGGRPGLGKAGALIAIGRSLFEGFDMDTQIIYEAHELITALADPTPYVPCLVDESLVKIFWSLLWQTDEFQDSYEAIIKHARHNKHPVGLVTQHEGAMSRMIREAPLFSWWLSLTSRSPITQVKAFTLFHGVQVLVPDRRTRGYRMDPQTFFYRVGNGTIPAISEKFAARYEGVRERGVADHRDRLEPREIIP